MSAKKKPNILLLFTDQQRFDALRCSGNEEILTPNMDAFAETGTRFTRAFTPCPLCVPARMSLITGQRGSRTRYLSNDLPREPAPELPTIMTLLHHADYRTHAVGKMHFRGRNYGLQRVETQEENPRCVADDEYLMYLREQGVRTRWPLGYRDLLYYQPQTTSIPIEHSPESWVAGWPRWM